MVFFSIVHFYWTCSAEASILNLFKASLACETVFFAIVHTPLFILIYKGENDVHERIAPLQIILLTACKNSLCITNKNTNENIWQ